MKLPEVLTKFLQPTKAKRETFLSLLIDISSIATARWAIGPRGIPEIFTRFHAPVATDSWEARIPAIKQAVEAVSERKTDEKDKVVLGFSNAYLTPTDDIELSLRPHIKVIAKSLYLEPIGFVSLHQAILYKHKLDEGVPPSVILIGIEKQDFIVSLFKIGVLVGKNSIPMTDDPALALERALKEFKDVEILPSRLLVYGGSDTKTEKLKDILLRHQWTTRANFMHFPKIEIVSQDALIDAVCLAGASELATMIGAGEPELEDEGAVHQQLDSSFKVSQKTKEKENNPPPSLEADKRMGEKTIEELETLEDVGTSAPAGDRAMSMTDEESNIEIVRPEDLGFGPRPAPRFPVIDDGSNAPLKEKIHQPRVHMNLAGILGHIGSLRRIVRIPAFLRQSRGSRGMWIGLVGGILAVVILSGVGYWFIPRARVTIFIVPEQLETTLNLQIDPKSTVTDPSTGTIAGHIQEKTVTGEYSVPASGKKKIGDQSKGKVTIFNKSLQSRLFRKGTVLTSGNLAFTLDDDVSVASASENLAGGTITYGKVDAMVTAQAIGTEGNISSGKELTFKDIATTIAVARNSEAFTGGTSKDVTVVSRADYEAIIAALEDELIGKAKEELVAVVSGEERLIDDTITTKIIEKTFTEELGQESAEVHGKATMTVSGISYTESDVSVIAKASLAGSIPVDYALDELSVQVTIGAIQKKKDGTLTSVGTVEAIAKPLIQVEDLRFSMVGKTIHAVQEYLQTHKGIGGVGFDFRFSPWRDRLPINAKNIIVSVTTQE